MEFILFIVGVIVGSGFTLWYKATHKITSTENGRGGVATEKDGSKTTQGNQST